MTGSTSTPRGVRSLGPIALAAALSLAGASQASAQYVNRERLGRAFEVGPWNLYPVATAGAERTDNLFYGDEQTGPRQPSTITTAGAALVADMPAGRSGVTLIAGLRARDHGRGQSSNLDFYGQADGRLHFSNGAHILVTTDYEKADLKSQTFRSEGGGNDPGELTFTGERYRRGGLTATVGIERGTRHRLYLRPSAERFIIAGRRVSGFYDSSEDALEAGGERQLSARLFVSLDGALVKTTLDRPRIVREDSQGTFVIPADRRESEALGLRTGMRLLLDPRSSLIVRAGWARTRFDGAQDVTFRGVIGSADIIRAVPGRLRVAGSIFRGVYPTQYQENDFYVATRARVEASNDPAARLWIGAAASYAHFDYDRSSGGGTARRDRQLEVSAWTGYRLASALEIRVEANRSARNSSLAGFDYEVNRVGLALRWGG